MTLADAVQKTVVLSHNVLRVDVNREHAQIWKVSKTRLTLRVEDLARVPPVGIIKGLLTAVCCCTCTYASVVCVRACGRIFFRYCVSG